MIRVKFNGENIPGTLLLSAADLKNASSLIGVLRDGADSLSQHLLQQFSSQVQQSIAAHNDSDSVSDDFLTALIDEFNRQLEGPSLYPHFAGLDLERGALIQAVRRQPTLEGQTLVRFNRLLVEEAYPQHIAKSPKSEWDAWMSLAADATAKVIARWEDWKDAVATWQRNRVGDAPKFTPAFEENVWKGIRDWLTEYVFHHKCAYCETREVGYIADAEHFRPKGQLRKVKSFDVDGKTEITHPGYFWLAYRWENLLPSCNTCNRYGGKKDAFPVGKTHVAVRRITDTNELIHPRTRSTKINGVFYLEPEDLDVFEDRLLLHPYFDDPEKHVYFQLNGEAKPRLGSKLGQPSIDVFHLNETNKVAQRGRIQSDDTILYMNKVSAVIPDTQKMKSVAEEIADQYFKGDRPYAAAVFASIRFFTGDSPISPDVLLKDTPYFSKDGSA